MSKRKTVIYSLNNINTNINTGNIIKTKQSILIAVSGGQDSICLLFIFIQLKKQWHWSFGIIYCNHLWQKSSFFSGSLVLKIAYMLTVPIYYVTTTDKIFSEQESRKWRYAIFFRISCFYNYTIISSGHTESDKTETVLFQFIRGGSLKSLVPLKTVKHFASNSKFVKKRYITNTFIYFKKNLTFLKKKQSRPRAGPRFLIRQSLYNRNLIKNEITYYSNKSLFFTAKKKFFLVSFRPRQKYARKKVSVSKSFIQKKIISQTWSAVFTLNNFHSIFHKNYLFYTTYKTNSVKSDLKWKQTDNKLNRKINRESIPKLIYDNKLLLRNSKKTISLLSATSNLNQDIYFLIRPITILDRFTVKKLVQYFILPVYPDTSNTKKKYYRNRIRSELIPTLRFFFNPQIHNRFFQFSNILINEQFHLNLLCKQLITELYIFRKKKFTLNITLFQNLPVTIQNKLVQMLIRDCTHTEINFSNIYNITKLVEKSRVFYEKNTIKSRRSLGPIKGFFSFQSVPLNKRINRIKFYSSHLIINNKQNQLVYTKKIIRSVCVLSKKFSKFPHSIVRRSSDRCSFREVQVPFQELKKRFFFKNIFYSKSVMLVEVHNTYHKIYLLTPVLYESSNSFFLSRLSQAALKKKQSFFKAAWLNLDKKKSTTTRYLIYQYDIYPRKNNRFIFK
jgi:tRNA(Ile)-lysidine synthetase-like protein